MLTQTWPPANALISENRWNDGDSKGNNKDRVWEEARQKSAWMRNGEYKN